MSERDLLISVLQFIVLVANFLIERLSTTAIKVVK